MKLRPFALRDQTLRNVRAGTCTVLWRQIPVHRSQLFGLGKGDLLWVREPFFLPKKFNHLSPSAAMGFDARPVFARSDDALTLRDQLGREHPARSLPKAWHRSHLLVTSVRREPIRSIPNEEIEAEGYPSRVHYQMAWDRQVDQWGGTRWEQNPTALRFTFRFFDEPAPIPDEGAPARHRPAEAV